MAKVKYVAKCSFDDGSKQGPSGKGCDYKVGEPYVGSDDQIKKCVKAGLICSESELVASKEVVDEKEKQIRVIQNKLEEANKALAASEKLNFELQSELDELKKAKK